MEKGGEGQEIDDLAEAFNTMSGNTKKLFDELRVVTDDIAHDLKTPLTRIRGMAEITVRGPRNWEIYQDTLGNIAEECDHMVSMINSMLEITRTESAIDQPLKDEVDFIRNYVELMKLRMRRSNQSPPLCATYSYGLPFF